MPEVRPIDANALKAKITVTLRGNNKIYVCGLIDDAPTIEAEPVRHGEWHECWHTDTVCASICTNCGKAATQSRTIVVQELMTNVRYPLCPNCGARMDGGADNV